MNNENVNENENENSLSKAKYILKESISWALILAAAVGIALFLTEYVIFKAVVPSGSMKDTIQVGDQLIGLRIINNVRRGDILIFLNPDLKPGDEEEYFIKRVIGMPGETLEIKDGNVYIDGKVLKEDYLREDYINNDFGPYEIPEGCYFMMGDNRNSSGDARFWTNKYLAKEDIAAKALFRWYPSIKFFKRPQYED